ncbi:HAD family hydrolase [Chromobacterium amazonense]|uniref:HAD family phosphatase n=1 Tax=Chromobacterium amazonense TaxID=1382803 RepID=A0ABU8UZB5_9NEIS|nr:HAD family phosphatase [Chromobacterium amazonense]MBM2884257.1 HAD family phosphatase [Chromobacterium amazonense]MDQ4541942.1 HAD family phosphatase [Chromobacterium amazonense]OHX18588.1 hydrolase [Chromobacterium amazonense]
MPRSFDALLFDMDGLMLDTERLSNETWRRAGAELGIEIQDEMLHAMVGMSFQNCIRFVEDYLGDAEAADRLQKGSDRHYQHILRHEEIPLKTGILELLRWVREQGIPRAVATSTRRHIADIKLQRSGLGEFFDVTVAGDEVARTKPAPDVYHDAAARLGVAARRCLVLEDSRMGLQAGVAAGARVILVPDLLSPSDDDRAAALAVCGDLHQALELIRAL